MAKKNRKCITCGTSYRYCPTCSGADRLAPAWKAEFCNETCKNIWDTCTKYNMEIITKEDAQKVLTELNVKKPSEYTKSIQRDIENITEKHEVVKTEKED